MSWEEAWGKDDSYYKLSLHFCLFYKELPCHLWMLFASLLTTRRNTGKRVSKSELKLSSLAPFYRQDLRPEGGSEGTPGHAAN